jgi:hypothetical protein
LKLIKTYNDRENELMEKLGLENARAENFKEKLKKMRTYGRKVRNIALDYFPVNQELPELLTKEIEIFLEDSENESVIQFLEFEILTLRERNKKLEYEIGGFKEETRKVGPYEEYKKNTNKNVNNSQNFSNNMNQSQNNISNNLNEKDIQRRLFEEINKLKNARPVSTSKELEKLKNEREQLVIENKKLKTMVYLLLNKD